MVWAFYLSCQKQLALARAMLVKCGFALNALTIAGMALELATAQHSLETALLEDGDGPMDSGDGGSGGTARTHGAGAATAGNMTAPAATRADGGLDSGNGGGSGSSMLLRSGGAAV